MNLEPETQSLLKLVHLVGVIIFLGNITVTAFWKTVADRTKEPKTIAFSQRLVTLTDIVFTFVGVVLILVSGYLMAEKFGGVTGQGWLRTGLELFSVTAVIWVVVLIPIQIKQEFLARGFKDGGTIPALYWLLSKVWLIAGSLAVILPFVTLYFMVIKP